MRYTVIVNASRISPEIRRDFRRRQNLQRQVENAKRERFIYFFMQRAAGVACTLFTALSAWLMDGDITIGAVAIPLGLYLICTEKMIIENDYYRKIMRGARGNDSTLFI